MELNNKQRLLLKVLIGIVVLMIVFPPYPAVDRGCHFYQSYFNTCNVVWIQLIAQLLAAVILGGILFLLAKDKK